MIHGTDWSSLTADEALRRLEARPAGLSAAEAASRLLRAGAHPRPRRRLVALGLFLNQFKSAIVLILLFATVASAFLGDWVDAAIILAIVLGSAILSFTQEYRANTAPAALRAQVALKATVLRDGAPTAIPADQVVLGDVALLSAGSLIPADGLVLEAVDFFVNQAVLTGETFPVEKQPGALAAGASPAAHTNAVFQGTTVRSGSARALVTALVSVVAVALPYTPLAGLLDFAPLPPKYLLGLAGIVALYVLAAELTKRWFYRRFGAGDLGSGTGLKGG